MMHARRQLLKGLAMASSGSFAFPAWSQSLSGLTAPAGLAPQQLAIDEEYWRQVATCYESSGPLVNLEHGYWGKMALPVQEHYLKATQQVNRENSVYARTTFGQDASRITARVALALGVEADEIVLTRNATEAIHNLIRQYQDLGPLSRILYSDIDYPEFKATMQWLADSRGLEAIRLDLPPTANQSELLELYVNAMDANPGMKLMLLTHASNQHGMVLPVKQISTAARERGIDVICDCAQSWGLLDFTMPALDVDWAGFNLHKWIGAPLGVGALYMRRGTLAKVSAYPGEHDPDHRNINTRIHTGTLNFAAILAVESALQFHAEVGSAAKAARLHYLHTLWRTPALQMPHIEVLGGTDDESQSGMGAFRLEGQRTAIEVMQLQKRLQEEFGIFTVMRDGLASGACIRVTPQVFTTPEEIRQLVTAMTELA